MRQPLAASLLALLLAAPAAAQDAVTPDVADPISLRRVAMQQVGAGMGALGAMAKREIPFEPAVAALALRTMLAAASGYGMLFPEGTEEGGGSRAAPAIWSDRAGFDAAWAKFLSDLDTTVAAPPTDLEALAATMGVVGANCRACHEDYRVERN